MIYHLKRSVKQIFDKHPLIANCLTYGTFTTSAEFLQQTLSIGEECKNQPNDVKKVNTFIKQG